MERWAIVNDDNVVDNLVVWDGETPWTPPDGHSAIALAGRWCDIGYLYDAATGTFSPPPPDPEP